MKNKKYNHDLYDTQNYYVLNNMRVYMYTYMYTTMFFNDTCIVTSNVVLARIL